MSTATFTPLASAHLDTPVARTWANPTQGLPDSLAHETITGMNGSTLSYSFDRTKESLRIIVTDKNSGEVLRSIEFKSFHANLHRTDKLSGLLLDRQV